MYFLSILMIFVSSYLVLSLISQKTDRVYGFLYLLLIAFSQIILSFEVLSLFSLINRNNFLICNFIFLIVSCLLFVKSERKFYIPEIKSEFKKIMFSLKRDKLLLFCGVCFCIFIIFQLITVFFYPITFGDAMSYYFTRTAEWIQHKNLLHYVTLDSRELIMPINFDMLYMMHFLFFKTETGCTIYPFIGYLTTVYVIYMFIKALGFSIHRALWSVFVFSSLALIGIISVIPNGELVSGGLLLSSAFLFFIDLKKENKSALYFSSLALALSIGVKTTAIIAIPAFAALFIGLLFLFKTDDYKQKIMYFTGFLILNFIIFSSYNYILNLVEFGNPISTREHILLNSFRGGIKGWYCNLIKYCFLIFDTSGINIKPLNLFIMNIQRYFLATVGCDITSYTSPYFKGYFDFKSGTNLFSCFLGMTGLFAFLPALLKSLFSKIKGKKYNVMKLLALSYIINLCVFSGIMVFTEFNNKYLITFAILSAPIVCLTYTKKNNVYKKLLSLLIAFYIVFLASVKPVNVLIAGLNNKKILSGVENAVSSEEVEIYNKLKLMPQGKVALIIMKYDAAVYVIEKLIFKGFSFNKVLPENMLKENFNEYDYIITMNGENVRSNMINARKKSEQNENCIYYDRNKKLSDDNNPPVSVFCKIPHEYFAQSGFQYLFETTNYIVIKNTKRDGN